MVCKFQFELMPLVVRTAAYPPTFGRRARVVASKIALAVLGAVTISGADGGGVGGGAGGAGDFFGTSVGWSATI